MHLTCVLPGPLLTCLVFPMVSHLSSSLSPNVVLDEETQIGRYGCIDLGACPGERASSLYASYAFFLALSNKLILLFQALWLQQAYNLEFLGLSTFLPGLFLSSCFFFAVNIWILGILLKDLNERNPSFLVPAGWANISPEKIEVPHVLGEANGRIVDEKWDHGG